VTSIEGAQGYVTEVVDPAKVALLLLTH